jgi:PA14 domain
MILSRAAVTLTLTIILSLVIPLHSLMAGEKPTDYGLAGYYFNNDSFSGAPIRRIDNILSFNWGVASPLPEMSNDYFTIRWMGRLQAPVTGSLSITIRSDDGVRVWHNQQLVIDDWLVHTQKDNRYTINAVAGTWYDLRIDYFEAKGNAAISLSWEADGLAKSIVPPSALRPLTQPYISNLPVASQISPVCLVGIRPPNAQVMISANNKPQRVMDLPETGFYANIALHPQKSTAVKLDSLESNIIWEPTILVGEKSLVLRVGDSLLLSTPIPARYNIVFGSGIIKSNKFIGEQVTRTEKFETPGHYLITAESKTGDIIGFLDIDVVDVDFDGPIASQLGFTREKGVEILGGQPNFVQFNTSDESCLKISVKESTDYGARLYLTCLKRGTPTIVARLASGAIIGTQAIDEFSIDSDALLSAVRNVDNDNVGISLIITPWIPNLQTQLKLFAHRTTFEGGGKYIEINTSDFDVIDDESRGKIGIQEIQLSMPKDESLYCLRVAFDQHSRHGTPVGGSSFNGAACDFEVNLLSIRLGDTEKHKLEIIEGAANPDNLHHGKHKKVHTITLTGANVGKHLSLFPDEINGATFDCVKEDNWRPLVSAKEKAETGFYSVKISGTEFSDKIEIYSECVFDISAKEDKVDKEKLYWLFPGQSVTVTAKLLKKGSRSGDHKLTFQGPTQLPPMDVPCNKVGDSVSFKIDCFERRLDPGDYSATIESTTKSPLFTIEGRQTLDQVLETYNGKELGFVLTGGSSINLNKITQTTSGSGNQWSATHTGTGDVKYENDNTITNHLAPGGKEEWKEQDKAPTDELKNYQKAVDFVQKHEEGHLEVWKKLQTPITKSVTGTGTGVTQAAAVAAAKADFNVKAQKITTQLVDKIYNDDRAAQDVYHGTPQGGNDFTQFEIGDRK